MADQPVEFKRTYCRICMVQYGIVAEVAGNRILGVRGDREHPLTKGYTCPKGRATGQVHRIDGAGTRPMIRKGSELVPVGWDESRTATASKSSTGGSRQRRKHRPDRAPGPLRYGRTTTLPTLWPVSTRR